jgi:hypothetical protein
MSTNEKPITMENLLAPIEVGEELEFENEEGEMVTATVEGFHEGYPILSEPSPATEKER